MAECKDTVCPLVPRIEALERDNEHNKEAHKDFYARLESSHTAVAVIDSKLLQIKEDTEEIKTTVQEMKDKPAKRWDGIVEKAIWAIVAAVIAFLLARIGL